MSIAVLIPCYNEAQTIAKVVKDFRAALPEADIYVYDNNSSDFTDEIARAAGAIVRYERKQGKGNVIRAMFRDIDADCYLMIDGDDTYPAENAPEMVRLVLQEGADMVVGDRLSSTYFTENKRAFHNAGNKTVRKLVNRLFRGDVKDIMTGYRAFSPLFVKTFPVLSKGFEIETEMTIHALDKNMNLREVAVGYRDRPEGSVSKLNTFRDGSKVLVKIGMLYKDYQPLRFFGVIACAFFALCLALFIVVLVSYFQTDILRIPTLAGVGFLFIAGAISLVCGLVLNTVVGHNRQDFELSMNMLDLMMKQHGRESDPLKKRQGMEQQDREQQGMEQQDREPGPLKKRQGMEQQGREPDLQKKQQDREPDMQKKQQNREPDQLKKQQNRETDPLKKRQGMEPDPPKKRQGRG